MATRADLQAQLDALEVKLSAAYDTIVGTLAPKLQRFDLPADAWRSYISVGPYTLTPPQTALLGTIFRNMGEAQRTAFLDAVNTVNALRPQAAAIYLQLHPLDAGLTDFQIFLIMVAAVAGGAALAGAGSAGAGAASGAAGASGAGAGASAGASAAGAGAGAAGASGVALSTVGTGAALDTTAGTIAEASTALAGVGATTGAAAASSAATTAGSLASTLGKGVADLTGSSTLGSLVSDVAGNIGSIVSDIEQFVKPLTDFASQILTGIQDLNKTFIQPVADFISKDYTTITGLVNEVHTLADSGLKGILAIPSALASAFTSLDAANRRLATQTGAINKDIAGSVLVPGIGDKIASPLGDIHALLNSAWTTPVPDVGNLQPIKLDESLFNADELTQKFNKVTAKLADMGIVGRVVAVLVDGFNDILGYLGSVENLVELAKQKGNQDLPVEPLGVEETIDAWWKNHFDESTALIELARHGIDETRARALYNLREWLPDPNTTLTMFYKGVITSEEVANSLTRQGFTQEDINALANAMLGALNPREAMAVSGRAAAVSEGFLPGSVGSNIPDDIKLLYPQNLLRADIGNFDWLQHWNIQGIDWWITGWYRGLVSDDEFKLACKAWNIPAELIPNMQLIGGQTIQLWMIPDLLATGALDEAAARTYLKFIGLEPNSVELMLTYGKAKANAGKGPDLLSLGKISEGNAKRMLEDGIINSSEYNSILIAHGYTPQAATLMADLAQQEIDLVSRKTFASNLITEFDLGQISLQQLQSQLGAEGYTQQEVANYTQQAETGLLKKAKRLSNTDVRDFLKAGIFSEQDALNTLTANGWSLSYAQAFVELWTTPKAAAQTQGSTPGGNTPTGGGA